MLPPPTVVPDTPWAGAAQTCRARSLQAAAHAVSPPSHSARSATLPTPALRNSSAYSGPTPRTSRIVRGWNDVRTAFLAPGLDATGPALGARNSAGGAPAAAFEDGVRATAPAMGHFLTPILFHSPSLRKPQIPSRFSGTAREGRRPCGRGARWRSPWLRRRDRDIRRSQPRRA